MIDQSTRMSCRRSLLLTGLLFLSPVWAQEDPQADLDEFDLPEYESIGPAAEILDLDDVDLTGNPLKRLIEKWPSDLVVAPVPGYSPQLGWNLKLIGGYFLDTKEEAEHAPSVLGGFVMFSENGSKAYGAGANLHFLDDKLRVQAGALHMDIRYDYYVSGPLDFKVPIRQDGPGYFVSGTWRVWKKLYAGIGYLGGEIDTEILNTPPLFPPGIIPDLALNLGAVTIPLQIDSRDNEQFPRRGWKVDGRAMLYSESVGGDFDAETYSLSANYYLPMRDQDVLASRIIVRGADGDAPFFLLSTLGGDTDLRGYPSGRYRDRYMYAVQSEYRWHFNDHWIFTGFAGFGEVADTFSNFGNEIHPAAGIGVRYVLSQKHKVSLSADIAVGDEGNEFYFGVNEAF